MKYTIKMRSIEENKALTKACEIEYVMGIYSRIKEIFDLVEISRKNISDQKIRNIENNLLLIAKDELEKRQRFLSNPIFDDIREKYVEYGLICLSLIELYREEISLYE